MLRDHFTGTEITNRFRKPSIGKQSSPVASRRPSRVPHFDRRRLRISCFADPRKKVKSKICVNVSGNRYQLTTRRLSKYPSSLLSDKTARAAHYDQENDEFFFDRNRAAFESVYHFYQTNGMLFWPEHIPTDLLVEELKFYGLYDLVDKEIRDVLNPQSKPPAPILPAGKTTRLRRGLWKIFEEPDSSIAARMWGLMSTLAIVISIVITCIHPFPTSFFPNRTTGPTITLYSSPVNHSIVTQNFTQTNVKTSVKKAHDPVSLELFIVELFCLGFFTLEYLLRFVASPQKRKFPLDFFNLVDLVAIVPFYVGLALSSSFVAVPSFAFLRIIHFPKIFRIFNQTKFYHGARVMGLTIKASLNDLVTLTFLIMVSSVLFSSFVYYFENWNFEKNTAGRDFESIPASFWWAVITLTSVGYGDMVPKTAGEC